MPADLWSAGKSTREQTRHFELTGHLQSRIHMQGILALGLAQEGAVHEASLLRQLLLLVASLLGHGLRSGRAGQGWAVASYLPGAGKPSVWAMLQVQSWC